MFLMKRNGSTCSASIWGLLWRNPKEFLILIGFRGCTSRFCFDIFYIVDFHSALNSQVSVPFKVIPIENLLFPDQRVPDNRTFMFTTLPDPKLKNHCPSGPDPGYNLSTFFINIDNKVHFVCEKLDRYLVPIAMRCWKVNNRMWAFVSRLKSKIFLSCSVQNWKIGYARWSKCEKTEIHH